MFPEQHRITKQITHLFITTQKSECQIRPHFFLTGPSGSGKSFLVNQVAEEMNIYAATPAALEPAKHHLRR